ncbi:MAG TPA: hypothetical protein VF975_00100 [Thermoanaerobaculia bacterium]
MKTKIAVAISTFALLLSTFGYAGQRGEERHGTWWKTLDRNVKLQYLTGLLDGEYLGALYALPGKSVSKECAGVVKTRYLDRSSVFESTTTGEIADKLDAFFKDPANGRVMVPSAVYYLSRQAAGDDRATLARLLSALRK